MLLSLLSWFHGIEKENVVNRINQEEPYALIIQ